MPRPRKAQLRESSEISTPPHRRRRTSAANDSGIPEEVLAGFDKMLEGNLNPEAVHGEGGLIKRVVQAFVERALRGEMTHHLGYGAASDPPEGQSNRRNGTTSKTLRSDRGPMSITVPRDRDATFEPAIVAKHARELALFDDKILSMYARGMSVRDIQGHLREIYNTDVSHDLISRVTDEVVDEVRAWQTRPLDATYLIVYLDALMVRIRDKGVVQNRAVYVVVGVGVEGRKDVLGLWIQATEGAKFWLSILNDLRQRGVSDILVLCADGLKGLPEAVEAAFPMAIFQTCIIHMVRASLRYVSYKHYAAVCADLKLIYTAVDERTAREALDEFATKWKERYPMIAESWHARWHELVPFLAFPSEIRRAIYTTNTIEALNRILRKTLKTRGHLPNDDAALKLLFLAIRNAERTWGRRPRDWNQQLMQFAIHFGERVPL